MLLHSVAGLIVYVLITLETVDAKSFAEGVDWIKLASIFIIDRNSSPNSEI